ncbi:MAG: hypothetical protein WA117_23995 [Verrucomicrobiia bacterium]
MNTILVRSLVVLTFVLLARIASGQTNAVPASTSPASAPAATNEAPKSILSLLAPAKVDSSVVDELRRLDESLARIAMRLDYNNLESLDAVRQQLRHYLNAHPMDKKVKAVLRRLNIFPTNVEVDFAFIAFPIKEVESMARKIGAASPSQDQLKQAWAGGRGRLLATSKAVMATSEQAWVEGAQQIFYPTEYQPSQPSAATGQTATNVTKGAVLLPSHVADRLQWLPMPGEFQMRAVGTSFKVTPQDSADSSLIFLTFIPELVGLEWTTLKQSAREASQTTDTILQQPAFYTHRVMTGVPMQEGQTLVTCCGPSKTGREQIYVFVNASTDLVLPEPPDTKPPGKNKRAANARRSPAPLAPGLRKASAARRTSEAKKDDSPVPPGADPATPAMIHKSYRRFSPYYLLANQPEKTFRTTDAEIKQSFVEAGIPFPPGASVTYNEHEEKLFVTNTPKNLDIIEDRMNLCNDRTFSCLEVECAFVAFPLKEVENMARKSGNISPTQEQIKRAWANGRGRLLATTSVNTHFGQETKVETGKEIIYPWAYQLSTAKNTSTPTTGSGRHPAKHSPGVALIPKDLHTRNAGTTLTVKASSEMPEWAEAKLWLELTDVKWMTIGACVRDGQRTAQLTLDQPVFHIQWVSTKIKLADGGTVVTGGMLNRSGTEVTYVLITTKIITIDGSPQPRTEDRKP